MSARDAGADAVAAEVAGANVAGAGPVGGTGEAGDRPVEGAVGDELRHGQQLVVGARRPMKGTIRPRRLGASRASRGPGVAMPDVALDAFGAHRVEDCAGAVDERHAGRLAVQGWA
jgi:hypothetical protein